jgi:predicted outer membrane protein
MAAHKREFLKGYRALSIQLGLYTALGSILHFLHVLLSRPNRTGAGPLHPINSKTQKQEHIMQKNNVLKKLVIVSAVASMFASFQVHAQTSQSTTAPAGKVMTDKTPTGAPGTPAPAAQDMAGQAATGAAATGQTAAGGMTKMSKGDEKIVMDMARANMAEIEAGKLALSKSQDTDVKTFAQQMIDDHTKALADVQTLAQQKGITLPTEPDAKHKAMAAKMEKMTGDAFNREYMKKAGVDDHKKVLAMLKKSEKSAKDADLKALAAKMVPTVEQHLKAAQASPMAKAK